MNAYLKKQTEYRDNLARAAQEMERQYVTDIFCLVLNEMYGFGAERLTALMKKVFEQHDQDIKMFYPEYVEADVMREHYDRKLKAIFGERFDPFEVRYEHAKQIVYDKSRKSWRQ